MKARRRSILSAVLLGCLPWFVPVAPAQNLSIRAHDTVVTAVGLLPDGTRAVTGDEDGLVRIWDATDGRLLASLQAHVGPVNDLQVSPNGKALATAGADDSVRVFSLSSNSLVRSIRPPERQKGMIEQLLGSEATDGLPGARSVAFSGDTRFVASGHGDFCSLVWDLKTGRFQALQGGLDAQQAGEAPGSPVLSVAISPNGRLAAAGERETSYTDVLGKTSVWARVFIWNPYTAGIVRRLDAGRSVVFLGFLPDNRHLVGALATGSVVMWDSGSGKAVKSFDHDGGVRSASLSAGGNRLVTAGRDSVRIWDLETGAVKGFPAGLGEEFTDAALNGDGTRVAIATADGRLLLRDVGALELEPVADDPPPAEAPAQQEGAPQQPPAEQLWDE